MKNIKKLQDLLKAGQSVIKELDNDRINEESENFIEFQKPSRMSNLMVSYPKERLSPTHDPLNGRPIRRTILGDEHTFNEGQVREAVKQ